MKIKISLASMNGRGAIAEIEARDLFGGFQAIDIIADENGTPFEVCTRAAASLRLAARRFEIMADSTAPLRASMQDAVNELADDAL